MTSGIKIMICAALISLPLNTVFAQSDPAKVALEYIQLDADGAIWSEEGRARLEFLYPDVSQVHPDERTSVITVTKNYTLRDESMSKGVRSLG